MTERAMRPEPGDGLAAAQVRKRRMQVIVACLMGAGGFIGALSAAFEGKDGGFLDGIPAGWAVAASVVLLLAMAVGGWRYNLATDELDRRDNMWACAVALNVYILGYAGWYLWWKGGIAPEPGHETIFIVTMGAMLLAYGYKKIRP